MSDLYAWLGALAIACGVCVGTAIDGPSDTDAAQAVADDALTAQQAAECRRLRGADAEVYTMGQHTVCRAAGPVAGVQR